MVLFCAKNMGCVKASRGFSSLLTSSPLRLPRPERGRKTPDRTNRVTSFVAGAAACAFGWVKRAERGRAKQRRDLSAKLNETTIALRQTEEKLRAFSTMAADWFWEQDADLRYPRPANIPLTTLPTDVGKTRWDLGDPAMDQRRWEPHKADLAARRPFRDFRWERIQTDGVRRYMSTSGDPIFDENGTFRGYHGTGRDITKDVAAAEELRLAKERAEAANRAKSAFLANMSHELRTPLNAIIGFSELIRDQSIDRPDNKYTEWASIILSSGQHLLDIINDVLELSRVEAVGPNSADDLVDLATVIASAVGMLELQAKANGVHFDCMLAEGEAVLRADHRAVKQVVLNLLANAVKFTPGGGMVSIRIETERDGGLVLVVSDPGVGIDPAAIASLCEPFTQANSSISRRFGGTGLGLAISQRLVVMHGGTLTIESALEQGTTVRASFPRVRVVGRNSV
jgi:signal transduction histidine kinase